MFGKYILNSNEYNRKLVIANNNISMKKYDSVQVRKKVSSNNKKYDVINCDIVDLQTGEVISFLDFQLMYENNEITKKEFFYTKEKYIYQNLSDVQKKLRNKVISLKRSKERIVNLINANINNNVKFLTLTFRDNITDVKQSNKEFTNFIKRFNYYLKIKKSYNEKLKYISVLETQKRGAIHYHILLFDCPFVSFEELMNIWGLGSVYIECLLRNNKIVKINSSNNDFEFNNQRIDNVGAYITKTVDYITKSFNNLIDLAENINDIEELENIFSEFENQLILQKNVKIFQTSKNLKKAIVLYILADRNFKIFELLSYFYFNDCYFSEYENELVKIQNINLNYKKDIKEFNDFLNDVCN
ncbi:MAG: hypothetical protein PWP46_468 [Fusobacteriaceae bacterium]|nr:hypothetical protein [Fusobacteriaceae bacterium]